jgi:hypothetical protein
VPKGLNFQPDRSIVIESPYLIPSPTRFHTSAPTLFTP